MGRPKGSSDETPRKRRPPAKTPEAREHELIGLATDVAEQQMRNGSASAMVITHFLKLGTTRDQLERARLEAEVELSKAKVEDLKTAKRLEDVIGDALKAFTEYKGGGSFDDDDEG